MHKYLTLQDFYRIEGMILELIGKDTHTRPWVDWEIDKAREEGKRIVGVYLRGGTEADIPESLEKNSDAIVNWNTDSIIDAIDGKNTFQSPDGSLRSSPYKGGSSNC